MLLGGTAVCSLAFLVFALLKPGASLAAILPCAIVSGAAMPPVGACLRTLWPDLLGDPAKVHAAFALESALLETTYIAGPVLIAGAIGAWSTAASAVACALLLSSGVAGLRVRLGVARVARRRRGRRGTAARCARRACGRSRSCSC